MKIETKYNIGDKVWIVYEANIQYGLAGEVNLYDDVITDIIIDKDGVTYATEHTDVKETDIIPYEDKSALLIKIQEVMNAIHRREKEDDEHVR